MNFISSLFWCRAWLPVLCVSAFMGLGNYVVPVAINQHYDGIHGCTLCRCYRYEVHRQRCDADNDAVSCYTIHGGKHVELCAPIRVSQQFCLLSVYHSWSRDATKIWAKTLKLRHKRGLVSGPKQPFYKKWVKWPNMFTFVKYNFYLFIFSQKKNIQKIQGKKRLPGKVGKIASLLEGHTVWRVYNIHMCISVRHRWIFLCVDKHPAFKPHTRLFRLLGYTPISATLWKPMDQSWPKFA